jgi:outer membrane immunogenic protein
VNDLLRVEGLPVERQNCRIGQNIIEEFGPERARIAQVIDGNGGRPCSKDLRALFYLKGGVAFTHNRWDLTNAFNFFSPNIVEETRTGYTVGVGVEYLFDPHWSVFGEYNYYGFNGNNLLVTNPGAVSLSGAVGLPLTFTSNSQQIQTVKVGVNYLFNLGPTPVVAKY